MIDGRHWGWQAFVKRMNSAAEQHNVRVRMESVGGAIVTKLPWRAPAELRQLAKEIEQQSATTCMHCAAPDADICVQVRQRVTLTLCVHCLISGKGRLE